MRKLTMKEMLAVGGGNNCPAVCLQYGYVGGGYGSWGGASYQCVQSRPGYLHFQPYVGYVCR